MLTIEYALTQPLGLQGLVLANSTPSAPLWGEETHRLRTQLSAEVRAVLDQHEAAGSTDSAAYQDAMMAFYRRHVIRLETWPASVRDDPALRVQVRARSGDVDRRPGVVVKGLVGA